MHTRKPSLLWPELRRTSASNSRYPHTRQCPRPFTSNTALLVIAPRHPRRPQLPFLGQRPIRYTLSGKQLVRLLSTENARYYKDQTLLGLKWGVVAWISLSLMGFALYTFKAEKLDQRRPTPAEWSYSSRQLYRESWFVYLEARKASRKVNWSKVGRCMYNCLMQLEDGDGDGCDTVRIELSGEAEAGWSVPVAFDVSKKSEAWKVGYFEAAMRGGYAAERTLDLMLDTTTGGIYPRSTIIGPSNPFPRALPEGSMAPPKEENCESALPDPSLFYNRIIYGIGFSSEQRIDALLAHANHLQHHNPMTAETLLAHAIEVAEAAAAPSRGAELPTSNILKARMAQAGFLARTSRAPTALPIYLSCLRSLRQAAHQASSSRLDPLATILAPPPASIWTILDNSFTRPDSYPLRIATGNESLSSLPDNDLTALEAELKLYVGEILYASGQRADGLAWTKEAVQLSRSAVRALDRPVNVMLLASKEEEERGRAAQETLVAGLRNWERMANLLGRKPASVGQERKGWWSWVGWGSNGEGDPETQAQKEIRDAAEAKSEALDAGLVRLVQFFDSPRD